MPLSCVDAHVHFWRYEPEEYAWLDEPMRALRRDFLPEDLEPQLAACGVAGVVAVQARQSQEETAWLLELQKNSSSVLGVVGWIDLRDPAVTGELDRFPALCGVRHIIQAEPAGFMLAADFGRGIEALTARDLSYDLLIRSPQLPEAIAFVDRHPRQRFVLDHLGKPNVAAGSLEPWRTELRSLAERPNVWLKVSGLVTEARWDSWQLSDLQPYLDTAFEAFGAARAMFGSDHPVCRVAAGYARVHSVVKRFIAKLSEDEQRRVLAGNACSFYDLRVR